MNNPYCQRVFRQLLVVSGISIATMTFAYADVILQVDDNIKVTAINGKTFNSSPFQSIQQSYTLQPGKHVITAKYDRLYDLRNDKHDYLRSDNITVTADMEDNQTYRLAMPGQPESYNEAKQFAKSPTLAVMKGSAIIAKAQGSGQSGGLFSGMTSIFGGGNAQLENQTAIAAINSQATNNTSTSTAIAPVNTTSSTQPHASTLDRFMQIWLEATPEEREKIRQWIKE